MKRRDGAREPSGADEPIGADQPSGTDGASASVHRDPQDHGAADPICPLCGRPIPRHARQSLHHLTPKLKGGRAGPTVLLHQICHNEIHSCLTEAELARRYNSIEALREHQKIAAFIAWVAGKDPAFHSPSVGNHRKRKKRR